MMDYRIQRLCETLAEIQRQDTKWGEQNHPDGTGGIFSEQAALNAKNNTDRRAKTGELTWRDILLEEVYEAMAESEPDKLSTELIQVAAVAIQWAAAIDRRL